MAFRNFRLQVFLRVLVLAGTLGILAWCLVTEHYLRSVYAGAVVVMLIVEFISYVDRINRDINTVLTSLMQRDFTTHFQSRGRSRTFDDLYETLNQISDVFKTISAEKEAQFRFLEMLVQHIRVGIISFDETGKISIANDAAKSLLRKEVLFSLKTVESFYPGLVKVFQDIRANETRLYKLKVNGEFLQLSLHAAEFKTGSKHHKLISMQNIRNELDTREMEAWQKLIRVMTHEIMNSVSPIISLSESMHGLVRDLRTDRPADNTVLHDTLDKGLDAIRVRSQGLFNFTQSYRKLTGIPKLSVRQTNTGDLIGRVTTLMEGRLRERGIRLTTSAQDINIAVDPDLMEHVLLNLLHNAVDALDATSRPEISVGAMRNEKGEVLLYVADNGEGIDESIADKIFIPFFTTRKHGSGIGLALAKQILHLHHADLTFDSEKGRGTRFVVRL